MLNKLWKNIKINKKYKREIKEVNFTDINLNEYIVIDVRSKREFKEGHLNTAINIPLAEINKSIDKYIKNRENKILVCCQYGIRSRKVAEILEEKGYVHVYNLKGGLENI